MHGLLRDDPYMSDTLSNTVFKNGVASSLKATLIQWGREHPGVGWLPLAQAAQMTGNITVKKEVYFFQGNSGETEDMWTWWEERREGVRCVDRVTWKLIIHITDR